MVVAKTRLPFPKIPRVLSVFSPKGALQVINIAPKKRVRAWGDGLLRLEVCQSREMIPRPVEVWPIHWILLIKSTVFIDHPTVRTSVAQGLFKGGSRLQNASGPSALPKKGCLKSQVINLTSPRSVKVWGNGPWGSRYVQRRDTPDQICVVDTTADPSVTHLLDPDD